MTETPKEVYIDSYENRTFVGTWHAVPPEGAECIKYVPESELTRLTAALKVAKGKLDASDFELGRERYENDHLRAELARVRGEDNKIFLWLLGYTDFPERQVDDGAYWWREELRKKLKEQGRSVQPKGEGQ